MQPIDDRPEPLDQLGITIPEFIEGLGLRLEYRKNVIRRPTSINGGSQWVVAEILSSALRILVQSCVKEGFEGGQRGRRIRSRRHGSGGWLDVVCGRKAGRVTEGREIVGCPRFSLTRSVAILCPSTGSAYSSGQTFAAREQALTY